MSENKKNEARIISLERKVDQMKEKVMHQFHLIFEDAISRVNLIGEGTINLNKIFT